MAGKAWSDLMLPCGKCIGCRLEYSRGWAVRATHEAQMHEDNCFVTLTYDDDHLPPNGSLVKADHQKFMKDLRERIYPKLVRCMIAGEYGDKNDRPHFHLLLFGYDFPDKKLWRKNDLEHPIWRSAFLEDLWDRGYSEIGSVSFESAAYVARYVVKKINGAKKSEHYGKRLPEYMEPSRFPGIGTAWLEKYWQDVYPADRVVVRGKECKPPRFYDKWLEKNHPELWECVHLKRLMSIRDRNPEEDNYRRQRAKEAAKSALVKTTLRRKLK